MRRLITTAVSLALVGGAALSVPAAATETGQSADRGAAPSGLLERTAPAPAVLDQQVAVPELSASQTLTTARRVLAGQARPSDPSATLVLRDLWMKRKELRGAERRAADAMLARPTDGANDPQGFGYQVPEAPPVCNARLCVHYVQSGVDAPPSPDWPATALGVMDSVWTSEVDQMGYRAPVSDGTGGGTPQFDVYLKDLGGSLYGFCAGENRAVQRTASAYCVLDNDFSPTQFPTGTPYDNLVVTGAHEFFHAVQYAYDYAEDPWMIESTATWMEERIATAVNDNRQYLPASQIYAPYIPLDAFSQNNGFQYGNWVFWEYLTTRYGVNLVRKVWELSGTLPGDPDLNSLPAINRALKGKGGFEKNFARYTAGNLTPAANFPEGAEYPTPQTLRGTKVLKKGKAKRFKVKIDHLSSASYAYGPNSRLRGKKWKLLVRVTGPSRAASPSAVVVVHMGNGKRKVKVMKLNRSGKGGTRVPFDARKVAAVSVSLINGSTRYRCNRKTVLACAGKPLDDNKRFSVTGRVVRR